MESRLIKKGTFPIALALTFAFALNARASQPNHLSSSPCAVLENFSGSVQIMDPSRTHLIDAVKKAPIPCGGWISIGKGSAEISHRDGYEMTVSANSFLQLPESNTDGKKAGDGLILYKGQAYVNVPDGSGTLNSITPNARARIRGATAIVIYSHADEQTQVIALNGSVLFENRFQNGRRMRVQAGEASELSFRQLRVVPGIPRAMAQSSLKAKLAELGVPERERVAVLKKALERKDRKFAAEPAEEVAPERVPAGLEFAQHVEGVESPRKRLEDHEGQLLQSHFVQKLSAGEKVGERILFPNRFHGRPQRVNLEVEDPGAAINQQAQKNEDKEKRRLIEELSQIRLE